MAKWVKYRLVTPGMDVTIGYQTRETALEDVKERAKHHPVKLYERNLSKGWTLIFDSEKGGETINPHQ